MLNGSSEEHDEGDLGQRLSPEQRERRRKAKGKERAVDHATIVEESDGNGDEQDEEDEVIDEEQEEREAKQVQETLKRWSELEKNRRASRRKNAASVTVTPPLADLSRRGSKLLSRARTHSRRSSESTSSSFDSYRSPSSYSGSHRPLRDQPASLGSLAEVQETVNPLRIDTSTNGEDEKGDGEVVYVETPTAVTPSKSHARSGSRFVEDLSSTVRTAPPNLDRNRPSMPNKHDSTYSLHSLASSINGAPILYARPAAEASSANLVGDELDDGEGFAAGFRHREVSVPWYEAVFCCACWGGSTEEGERDEQDGQTMPAYV